MLAARNSVDTLTKTTILFVSYLVIAKLGLMLGAVGGFATLVWPPTGLALCALLLFGYRVAPGVLLGAFVVNLWTGAPAVVALGMAVGNTTEAVLGAYAMRRLAHFDGSFDRLRHVMVLIVPVAMLSTLVSATLGVTSLMLGGIVSAPRFFETWRAWWVGDMLGDLVVAPLLLTWATLRGWTLRPLRVIEGIALLTALVVASVSVFFRARVGPVDPFGSSYVLFPLFVWAAVRFELRGAVTVTALASVLAVWATTRGLGPFARNTLAEDLLALQIFMGVAAFTPLVVAGAVSDRDRAMRARETFVATISHDLKNPLNVIRMSSAALAKEKPSESLQARIQKHDELIERSVGRATRLLADLLDAAAIDAGHLSVERRREEAGALLADSKDSWDPLAAAKNLALRIEAAESFQITCDRERVLQVLSNLIGNAIKFTSEGGTVTIKASRAGHVGRLSVEDTGPGIEATQLRHVFDRYWHARSAYGGGSGLGLFIAKGIVESHGGKIWVESRVGVGSTFHVMLPLE